MTFYNPSITQVAPGCGGGNVSGIAAMRDRLARKLRSAPAGQQVDVHRRARLERETALVRSSDDPRRPAALAILEPELAALASALDATRDVAERWASEEDVWASCNRDVGTYLARQDEGTDVPDEAIAMERDVVIGRARLRASERRLEAILASVGQRIPPESDTVRRARELTTELVESAIALPSACHYGHLAHGEAQARTITADVLAAALGAELLAIETYHWPRGVAGAEAIERFTAACERRRDAFGELEARRRDAEAAHAAQRQKRSA